MKTSFLITASNDVVFSLKLKSFIICHTFMTKQFQREQNAEKRTKWSSCYPELSGKLSKSVVGTKWQSRYGDTTQIFTIILPIAILFNHALKQVRTEPLLEMIAIGLVSQIKRRMSPYTTQERSLAFAWIAKDLSYIETTYPKMS